MTLLEVCDFKGGWIIVAHPLHLDEAVAVATARGDGFYVFHYLAFTERLEPRGLKTKFFGIIGGQIAGINPYDWPEDHLNHVKRYRGQALEQWTLEQKEQTKAAPVVTIEKGAEEYTAPNGVSATPLFVGFSRYGGQALIPVCDTCQALGYTIDANYVVSWVDESTGLHHSHKRCREHVHFADTKGPEPSGRAR